MEIFQADTSRDPDKPDLHPLPDEPPEDPTDHGWKRGLRDWFWSDIRQELHVFTGGAPNYTDCHYPLGVSVLEVLEKRARFRGLGFPRGACSSEASGEALEWFEAGLRAASFSIGGEPGDEELLFQGPDGLPEFFLEKAMGFAVRRADRALDLYGSALHQEVPEPPDPFEETGTEPEEGEDSGEEAPTGAYEQGSLF